MRWLCSASAGDTRCCIGCIWLYTNIHALLTCHTLATFRHCGDTVLVVEEKSVAINSCLRNLELAVSSKQVSNAARRVPPSWKAETWQSPQTEQLPHASERDDCLKAPSGCGRRTFTGVGWLTSTSSGFKGLQAVGEGVSARTQAPPPLGGGGYGCFSGLH